MVSKCLSRSSLGQLILKMIWRAPASIYSWSCLMEFSTVPSTHYWRTMSKNSPPYK